MSGVHNCWNAYSNEVTKFVVIVVFGIGIRTSCTAHWSPPFSKTSQCCSPSVKKKKVLWSKWCCCCAGLCPAAKAGRFEVCYLFLLDFWEDFFFSCIRSKTTSSHRVLLMHRGCDILLFYIFFSKKNFGQPLLSIDYTLIGKGKPPDQEEDSERSPPGSWNKKDTDESERRTNTGEHTVH